MSTLCPKCNTPLSTQIDAPQNLYCDTHGWLSQSYLWAVENSIHLDAAQLSPRQLKIRSRSADDDRIVRILFERPDRKQEPGRIWVIRCLHKYEYLPFVKNAQDAYRHQYTLEDKCPALTKTA